jgi:hypothetical protein
MEINANGRTPGIPHCTFKGTILAGVVSSDVRVDDGRWHTISCRRTRTAVEIDVDGTKHRESSVTGPMSNTYPIAIAGKAECNPAREIECDYFTGELADLRIVVG